MAATPRMVQLEALLRDDPADPFLRYGIALEHASSGDDPAAAAALASLVTDSPDYVPAYLMAGQILARLGRESEAVATLRSGVAAAQAAGNTHAAGEMVALLATVE